MSTCLYLHIRSVFHGVHEHKDTNNDPRPSTSHVNVKNTDHHTEDKEGKSCVQVNGASEEVKRQNDVVQTGGSVKGLADDLHGSSQLTDDSVRHEEEWIDITDTGEKD
ncbi:uncharacterized [Tachysurus ichikawai]